MCMLLLLAAMPGKCNMRKCHNGFVSQNMHPVNFCCRALCHPCMQAASMLSEQCCKMWKELVKPVYVGLEEDREKTTIKCCLFAPPPPV